jgi:hypothetical protein
LVLEALEKAFPRSYNRKIVSGRFKRGLPDNFCCINGVFVAIEAKKQGEVPTLLQECELNNVAIAGGVSLCVIFNLDKTKDAINYTIDRGLNMAVAASILKALGCVNVRAAAAK